MYIVIYSVATGRVRRAIKPDGDPQKFLPLAGVGKGEAAVILNGATLAEWQAAVSEITKLIPSNDRYVVVDRQNKIVGAILADPECDDVVAGATLVRHENAKEDWTFDGEKFVAPVVVRGPKAGPDDQRVDA